jgi:predicted amidophosphoribosyltransferase
LLEYRYKRQAIARCGVWLGGAINHDWLNGATLVPVPPSKAVGDPEYDDRVSQICRSIPATFALDVRELVTQRTSLRAAHETEYARPTVEELLAEYEINEALADPSPRRIAIVDDVLTAGTHFRAMHMMLSNRSPGVPIVGMFIARRVFPNDLTDDLASLL